MSKSFIAFSVAAALVATAAVAQEPTQNTQAEREPTKATYLVTGLHCPPCTSTVERSLQRVKGIRSIKVDWKTKNAQIVFDESLIPAQRVAQLIGTTPHMMGSNMHYGGWLALKVPALKDAASAKQIKDVLSKVEGVQQVATYPSQNAVGIAFDAKGKLTSAQLIDVLNKAGIKSENL